MWAGCCGAWWSALLSKNGLGVLSISLPPEVWVFSEDSAEQLLNCFCPSLSSPGFVFERQEKYAAPNKNITTNYTLTLHMCLPRKDSMLYYILSIRT